MEEVRNLRLLGVEALVAVAACLEQEEIHDLEVPVVQVVEETDLLVVAGQIPDREEVESGSWSASLVYSSRSM